jgi:DNA-binding transcriptional MocR family regulator
MPEGTRITNPKGGFMLWMALPEQIDTLELLDKTVSRGVSFNPGVLFSASNKHSNCLRLNCALKWNDKVKDSLKIIAEEAHKLL